MHILITGGAGFVGSNLAFLFKDKYPHYHITCLDNLKRRGSELNLARFKTRGITFVHGDIRNHEDLDSLSSFDCLIDASAEPSVLAGINSSTVQLINNNLVGTINCVELAQKYAAKFIFLSTSRVYPIATLEQLKTVEDATRFSWCGDQLVTGISQKGISESFPLTGSRSFYGATKLASELLIQEYIAINNLQAVINRCGVIAGPWQMGKVDQGVVGLWVARHFWKQHLSYIGYGGIGKQVREILHPVDLFNLIDLQVHNISRFSGQTFNIGGGLNNSVSLQELTQLCQEVTGNIIPIEKVSENRPMDLKMYITDNSQIERLCGWKPSISPQEIVEQVYSWIRQHEELIRPILG